jgi:hypothetical protein
MPRSRFLPRYSSSAFQFLPRYSTAGRSSEDVKIYVQGGNRGMVTAMLAHGNHSSSPKRPEQGGQRSLVPSPPGPSVPAPKENKSGVTMAKVFLKISLSLSLSIYIYIIFYILVRGTAD